MQLANCPRNYHCEKRVKHECVVIIQKAFFNYFVSSSLRKKQQQNIPSSCIRMLVFSRFLARATSWSVTLVQIRILNTAKISTIKTKFFSNTMEFWHERRKPRHFFSLVRIKDPHSSSFSVVIKAHFLQHEGQEKWILQQGVRIRTPDLKISQYASLPTKVQRTWQWAQIG